MLSVSVRSCRSILAVRKRHVSTVSFTFEGLREPSRNDVRSFSSYKSPPSGESNETKQYSKVGNDDRLSDYEKKHQEQLLDPQVPVPSFNIPQSQRQKHQEQQLTLLPPQQQQQQTEMERLQLDFRNVTADIATVEKKIDIVEQNIKFIKEKLENNFSSNTLHDKAEMYYLEELKALRGKEKDLRNKEAILLQQQLQLQQQQTNLSHSRPPLLPITGYNNRHSKMELRTLKEAMDIIDASHRATPQVSAPYLGDCTIKELKERGWFVAFSCPSPSQPTKDTDLKKARDQQRPVLTLSQHKLLMACKTEHQMVAFITPYLEEIVQELGSYVVVNSEEYKWLEIGDDASSDYKIKPDMFVGHEAIVTYRPPFRHMDKKLNDMRRQTDKFGILTHRKLRSFIGMTCEAKMKINNRGFGQILNYGRHICRRGYRIGDDGPDLTKLMLFDKNEFWLITVLGGFASYVTTCQWTTPGSFDLIRNFVLKPKLMTVLDQACQHFQVRVVADETTPYGGGPFLGAGTFGFVFRVKRLCDEHSCPLALKICVSGRTGDFDNVRRLIAEHERMLQVYEKCPNVVMGIEDGGFQRFVDKNNQEVGAALLMSHVGKGFSDLSPQKIIDSLKELHSNNISHGDARLANVVSVNGNPVWIDFCESVVVEIPGYFNRELEQLEEEIRTEFFTKSSPRTTNPYRDAAATGFSWAR